MHYLKSYFWISLLLYACLSLQTVLWFYLFPFSPTPQVWIGFLVYAALYSNKASVVILSFIISFLLTPYTLFKGFPLFLSLCSYGYIILYTKNTLLSSSIKTFFIFSLFGLIIIQIFYSTYTMQSFSTSLEKSFSVYNIYSSLLTGILSLLFFYIFQTKKLFFDTSDYPLYCKKTMSWI